MAVIGPPTSRSHIPSALEANLRKAYILGIKEKPLFIDRIYNVNPSSIKVERDAVYAGYTTYQAKSESDAIVFDSGQEAWNQSYTHRSFALGCQVTIEAMQDDMHGVIKKLAKRQGGELSAVARYTMERDAMDLFNSKLTSGAAYTAGGTDYSVLSLTHYRVDGGSWANRPTGGMDLSQEALEFMLGHWMANQKNQRGQLTMTMPQRLMVGASDLALAKRLVETKSKRPQGNDNDINPVTDYIEEAFAHPLLTNDSRWLAFGEKSETGLNYFRRMEPDINTLPDGDNGNQRFYGMYRESHGLTHANNIWGSD